ncbi:MAG: translation initiation factor IF-1 [Opitutia bacterium]|jgi:translation initiation factor IF-1|nr:MAG: translation initiation factor IF-1 [Opitutae bacterium]
MPGESAFVVEGAVVETLPHGLLRVELANGHRLLGHVARRQAPLVERVKVGATVTVKLASGDLSHGLVILNESKL